jgi:UDP-GlcNAc:undecaprenyl-phosphate GlcNAc-1-phosphate transferase
VALIVAFLVAVAATPVIARVASRLGVVDHPGPLKVHDRPVPYLGGIAVFIAVAAGAFAERPSVLLPLGLALVLGAADDIVDLPARWRLVGEVGVGVAAAVVVPTRGPLGSVATVALVILLLNAVNLLDGLDGLASGVAAISALGFAFAFSFDGEWSALALALTGALLGFLVWNRPPARIYLGDAGSYLVGTALALLLASAWAPGESAALGAGSLLFVAVPVADTTIAIVRRARAGRPLLVGDRGHVYDQLVDRGWRPLRVTVACVVAQAVLVAIGIGIVHMPVGIAIATTAAIVVVVGTVSLRVFTPPGTWTA